MAGIRSKFAQTPIARHDGGVPQPHELPQTAAELHAADIPTTVYLVKSLEAVNRQRMDRIVRGSAVTTMQYVALGVLQQSPEGMTAAMLARRTFVTPQSMQDMVKSLESKGLISRRHSAENRSNLVISITPAGEAVMDDLWPHMVDLNATLLEGFSEIEVQMLRALLHRARKNLAE